MNNLGVIDDLEMEPQEKLNVLLTYMAMRPHLKTSVRTLPKFIAALCGDTVARLLSVLKQHTELHKLDDEFLVKVICTYLDLEEQISTDAGEYGNPVPDIGTYFSDILAADSRRVVPPPAGGSAGNTPAEQPACPDAPPVVEEYQDYDSTVPAEVVLVVGDKVLYTHASTTVHGEVTEVFDNDTYSVTTDNGAVFSPVSGSSLTVADDDQDTRFVAELKIPGKKRIEMERLLDLQAPVSGRDGGDILLEMGVALFQDTPHGLLGVVMNVVNGDEGPWLDIYLEDQQGNVVADSVPSREVRTSYEVEYLDHVYEVRLG